MKMNEENIKHCFSEKLKTLLAQHKLNEVTLSKETGISQSAINRIKNGTVCPSLYQASLLANFFQTSIDEFIPKLESNIPPTTQNLTPILVASKLINNNLKEIYGFYESADEAHNELLGFKVDNSFDCKMFNKETTLFIKPVSGSPSSGSTVLFIEAGKFKVGNFSKGKISQLDDFSKSYSLNKIITIGEVAKIETNITRNPALVEKIIQRLGKNRIMDQIEKIIPANALDGMVKA